MDEPPRRKNETFPWLWLATILPGLFFLMNVLVWIYIAHAGSRRSAPSIPMDMGLALGDWALWQIFGGMACGVYAWAKTSYPSKSARWILLSLSTVAGGSVLFFFVFSWAFYCQTRIFLGLEEIFFIHSNGAELIREILSVQFHDASLTLFITVVLLGVGVGVIKIAVRELSQKRGRTLLRFSFMVSALISLSLLLLGPIDKAAGAGEFIENLHYHADPLARLVFDAVDMIHGQNGVKDDPTTRRFLTPSVKQKTPLSAYIKNARAKETRQYNVIYIFVEALRADALGKSEKSFTVMPHLTRLAKKSLVFSHAYAQSTHTDYAYPCGVSSQFPLRSLAHYYYSPLYDRVMIYDVFKKMGYRTALFSSQTLEWGRLTKFIDTGNLDTLFHGETYTGETYVDSADIGFADARFQRTVKHGKIDDHITVREACRWLSQHKDGPFFLSLDLQSSHFPYRFPEQPTPRFRPFEINFHLSFFAYPRPFVHVMRNRYWNALAHEDALIGGLIDQLEASHLMDSTILVVTGDHGEAFYEHNTVTHAGPLWNEVLQVPLVIYAPNVSPGVAHHAVQLIDISPTVLSLLGLPSFPGFQGHDMLQSKEYDIFSVVQTGFAHQFAILRQGRKLIEDEREGTFSLYDLRRDVVESQDVCSREPQLCEELKSDLQRWKDAQLLYYGTPEIRTLYYPPSFDEVPAVLRRRS